MAVKKSTPRKKTAKPATRKPSFRDSILKEIAKYHRGFKEHEEQPRQFMLYQVERPMIVDLNGKPRHCIPGEVVVDWPTGERDIFGPATYDLLYYAWSAVTGEQMIDSEDFVGWENYKFLKPSEQEPSAEVDHAS